MRAGSFTVPAQVRRAPADEAAIARVSGHATHGIDVDERGKENHRRRVSWRYERVPDQRSCVLLGLLLALVSAPRWPPGHRSKRRVLRRALSATGHAPLTKR